VVDDASTDASLAVVCGYDDPRIRVFRHAVNQGVMAARDTAAKAAEGKWLLILDSDDELVDAATMQRMYEQMKDLPEDIMAVGFACRDDAGVIVPNPPWDGVRDYRAYLRFVETYYPDGRCTEVLNALRRDCPPIDLGEEHLKGLEELYLLEFHKRFRSQLFTDVCRVYHQDADNQLTKMIAGDLSDTARLSRDRSQVLDAVIERHGAAMREHAPRAHWLTLTRAAVLHFTLGNRRKALGYCAQAIRLQPLKPRSWAVPVFGLVGTTTLQRVRQLTQRRRLRAA